MESYLPLKTPTGIGWNFTKDFLLVIKRNMSIWYWLLVTFEPSQLTVKSNEVFLIGVSLLRLFFLNGYLFHPYFRINHLVWFYADSRGEGVEFPFSFYLLLAYPTFFCVFPSGRSFSFQWRKKVGLRTNKVLWREYYLQWNGSVEIVV